MASPRPLPDVTFVKMTPKDISEYKRWFKDPELARRMYKPDAGWIDYVTKDGSPSAAWSALKDGKLIAHLQTEKYDDGSSSIAIALKPAERGRGYSSEVIKKFVSAYLDKTGSVLAFVEHDNPASRKAFERSGFKYIQEQPDEDGMVKLAYQPVVKRVRSPGARAASKMREPA